MFMVVPRGVGDTRLETADHVKTSELLLKEECPGDDKEGVDMCLSSRGQHLRRAERLGLPLNASAGAQIF